MRGNHFDYGGYFGEKKYLIVATLPWDYNLDSSPVPNYAAYSLKPNGYFFLRTSLTFLHRVMLAVVIPGYSLNNDFATSLISS